MRNKVSLLPMATLLLSFAFWISWSIMSNDFDAFDASVTKFLHYRFLYARFIFTLIKLAALYSTLLCVTEYLTTYTINAVHIRIMQLLICIAVAGYCAIVTIWKVMLKTIYMHFQIAAPLLHFILQLASTSLICNAQSKRLKPCSLEFYRKHALLASTSFISLILLIMTAPSVTKSPCVKHNIFEMPKPFIFGHRGHPFSAPENTVLAFEDSAEADGYEADVAVSFDGVPFLIHDSGLLRTTNVKDVFPDRQYNRAELFTWKELQKLNAGKWFLDNDPYGTAASMSERKRNMINKQKIMSLSALAKMARENKKDLIFDLREPPMGTNHPYLFSYIRVIVNTLLDSGIDQSKVWWISGPQFPSVLRAAPRFRQVYGAKIRSPELARREITSLILEYNSIEEEEIIEYYSKYNITTILYSAGNQWTFSICWCRGAQAVISNDPTLHRKMKRPLFSFTPKYLNNVLLIIRFLCLTVILINYYYCR